MNSHSQKAQPTAVGEYIDLYREICGTTPLLNGQECSVIERLAAWAVAEAAAKSAGLAISDSQTEARALWKAYSERQGSSEEAFVAVVAPALCGPAGAYDVIADAVNEVAEAAQVAFRLAGIEPEEWDSDDIVRDVSRGIANDIERMGELIRELRRRIAASSEAGPDERDAKIERLERALAVAYDAAIPEQPEAGAGSSKDKT